MGRPRKLSPEQIEVPLEVVRERPGFALEDVVTAFRRASGVTFAAETARKYLREAGFERVVPPATGDAGDPTYPRRLMLDACVYVLRSGCSWRMLPKDMPPWILVYRTFRRWLAKGLFEQLHDELRVLWRSHERRDPDPTAAILDSQSVKTTAQGGPKCYDAGKKGLTRFIPGCGLMVGFGVGVSGGSGARSGWIAGLRAL